jgi:hypothetical protein
MFARENNKDSIIKPQLRDTISDCDANNRR